MAYNKKAATLCARKLKVEYTRTRKRLSIALRRKLLEKAAKAIIGEEISLLTERQQLIMIKYLAKSFLAGIRDAKNEIKGATTIAAAASTVSIEFASIDDPALKKIAHNSLGQIGKYNANLSKSLITEYDKLLSDNRLSNSLNTHGYTPWLGETLKKKGIDPAVISLIKKTSTSNKMLQILNTEGIHGGMHPDQVARRLMPHVNRYFGTDGVEIDNIGKTVKQFRVDANGNYEWFDHKITRKYKATPRTYSKLIAQTAMKNSHREAYYRSLQKTKLVDHFISVSVMDARTCSNCAAMHGVVVSHADGPLYHPRCHCDLRPVWRRDSLLADKNKPDRYYERQQDMHFLRMNDLKKMNETLPSGSKLSNYALLPDSAKSGIMPGPLQMNKIKDAFLGHPPKIAPVAAQEMAIMSDAEWEAEANTVFAKTKKDGVEHLALFNVDGTTKHFKGIKHEVAYRKPTTSFSSIHSHPAEWDSPLSEQDFVSFLSCKNEVQMAATSSDHIYIISKHKGANALTTATQKQKFLDEFKYETNSFFHAIDTSKYSGMDYHYAYLKAGKKMAKKYDLDYKVIARSD